MGALLEGQYEMNLWKLIGQMHWFHQQRVIFNASFPTN
jgi:hypothetical protein